MLIKISVITGWSVGYLPGAHETAEKTILRRYSYNVGVSYHQIYNKVRCVKILSRDCDGCERQLFECKRRFEKVSIGEKVFCPDGTVHLVDS